MNMSVLAKFEAVLELNPLNFYNLYFLFHSFSNGHTFRLNHPNSDYPSEFYLLKLHEYAFKLLDHPQLSGDWYDFIRCECYHELADVFYRYRNPPTALKYYKLAYEYCLRSTDKRNLSCHKNVYIRRRADFAQLPPLRFAVGDEVEFLHKLETGSEWKLGKVVELHYRERVFDLSFNAPYRLQLLDDSDSGNQPPVYAWVKADIDRYVRRVGVRSIEGTRYQARLDAKVEELSRLYCSNDFLHDIYHALAQDHDFVQMLLSVWQVELSEHIVNRYRMFVLYRQPFIRTDSGYHVPSSEEVIAGIKAYFDPAHLRGEAATFAEGEISDSQRIREVALSLIVQSDSVSTSFVNTSDAQVLLLRAVKAYIVLLLRLDSSGSFTYVDLREWDHDFSVPQEVSDAISRASSVNELSRVVVQGEDRVGDYLEAWCRVCLENPDGGPTCECLFIYFFIKTCLDHGWGVPKLGLALYDRMNIQLSREFIRCANPSCEHNKLDHSTGKIKFKQCSRCKAVIYCSRECQTAHYPEHKRLCREHLTG